MRGESAESLACSNHTTLSECEATISYTFSKQQQQ